MEPYISYARDVETGPLWRFEGIRKGNARQLIPVPFEPGVLRQFLVAALPGDICRVQHALQGMTRHPELFAVLRQQIVKGFLAVIATVFGILFDLANRPIPDAREVPQPVSELLCLRCGQTQFELPLDHATPVSDARCIAC